MSINRKQASVVLDPETWQSLQTNANLQRKSKAAIIRHALEKELARLDKQRAKK